MDSALKAKLDSVQTVAITSKINTATDILIPAYSNANSVDILMGYFSSSSFAEIAPGLATFLNHNNGSIRLLISPHLTAKDLAISQMSPDELSTYLSHAIFDVTEGEEHISEYTLSCFAWMLAEGRMEIKIAKMKEQALFHPKIYIFQDATDTAVLHGSMNYTKKGITSNVEQLSLSKSWVNKERATETEYFQGYFANAYKGKDDDFDLYELDEAVRNALIQKFSGEQNKRPQELIWSNPASLQTKSPNTSISAISIPEYLVYSSGDFKHQGDALAAWLDAGMSGILDMATGAGKTITSLICAHSFQEHYGRGLFIISAPQIPLMLQWLNEVQEFGPIPTNLSEATNWEERSRLLKKAERKLNKNLSKAEIFIVSNSLLKKQEFTHILNRLDIPIMLISDECHNFGVDFLSTDMKQKIQGKLGLSATPERQYDLKGTEFLSDFFGEICFKFGLEDAIGKCLTPYYYNIIPIYLDEIEMDEFCELSAGIRKLMWQNDNDESPQLDDLRRKRRKVIETAEMKVSVLRTKLIQSQDQNKHTLIYCTDKDPEQLETVNKILKSLNLRFRQLTSEETKSKKQTQQILDHFRKGSIEILTAKRVLDEGVNIPETRRAFILASNTVERQWTQRRGRILRKCSGIGKNSAEIFDFVVLPPVLLRENPELTIDDKKLIELELKRVKEFSRLSTNKTQQDGPFAFLNTLNQYLGEN